jgi:hypothetical protein
MVVDQGKASNIQIKYTTVSKINTIQTTVISFEHIIKGQVIILVNLPNETAPRYWAVSRQCRATSGKRP